MYTLSKSPIDLSTIENLKKKHEKFSLNSLDPDQKNGVKSNNQPQMSPFEPTEKIFTVTRL